jgi:hypothetical protein
VTSVDPELAILGVVSDFEEDIILCVDFCVRD